MARGTVRIFCVTSVDNGISWPLAVRVRVHLRTTLADVFGIGHPSLSFPIRAALRRIAQEDSGVLLILRKPETPQEIVSQLVNLHHRRARTLSRSLRAPMILTSCCGAMASARKSSPTLECARCACSCARSRTASRRFPVSIFR